MLEVICFGTTNYQVGVQHGKQASRLISDSIQFYSDFFSKWNGMSWETASSAALKFEPYLSQHVPHLVEEMKGIAEGADVPFSHILALNSRSEVALGMINDGCTSLAYKSGEISIAGQTWDWELPQKERLVLLHIKLNAHKISLVTEAGLLSKTGINSSGVGVFLNAIQAYGVNYKALPIHVGLRVALEEKSNAEAVARLQHLNIATAAHFLIADDDGATCVEFSHLDVVVLPDKSGRIAHTNHFLADHTTGVVDRIAWPDSISRMHRAAFLMDRMDPRLNSAQAVQGIENILSDEEGLPLSINKAAHGSSTSATLFSIVADLKARTAVVRLGRPTECEGLWTLHPGDL